MRFKVKTRFGLATLAHNADFMCALTQMRKHNSYINSLKYGFNLIKNATLVLKYVSSDLCKNKNPTSLNRI